MKILKNNQILIYTFALMLVAAGYLNYTTNIKNESIETSQEYINENNEEMADIGDATLVNSNDVIKEEKSKQDEEKSNESEVQIPVNEEIKEVSKTVDTNNDYFAKSKLERDSMYSQMIETYEKILNSSNSNETQKQTATQEITKINEKKNSIMICENLIKTKGFENCVVFINEESISVIIGTNEQLKQEEIAQIQNIISRELKSKIENIHISTK